MDLTQDTSNSFKYFIEVNKDTVLHQKLLSLLGSIYFIYQVGKCSFFTARII